MTAIQQIKREKEGGRGGAIDREGRELEKLIRQKTTAPHRTAPNYNKRQTKSISNSISTRYMHISLLPARSAAMHDPTEVTTNLKFTK